MLPSPIILFAPMLAVALLLFGVAYLIQRFEIYREKKSVMQEVARRGGQVTKLRWRSRPAGRTMYHEFEVTYLDNHGQPRQAFCIPGGVKSKSGDVLDGMFAFWSDDRPVEALPDGTVRATPPMTNGSAPRAGDRKSDVARQIDVLRAENARLRKELNQLKGGRR